MYIAGALKAVKQPVIIGNKVQKLVVYGYYIYTGIADKWVDIVKGHLGFHEIPSALYFMLLLYPIKSRL